MSRGAASPALPVSKGGRVPLKVNRRVFSPGSQPAHTHAKMTSASAEYVHGKAYKMTGAGSLSLRTAGFETRLEFNRRLLNIDLSWQRNRGNPSLVRECTGSSLTTGTLRASRERFSCSPVVRDRKGCGRERRRQRE